MLIYSSTKDEFLEDVVLDCIVDKIHEKYSTFFGKSGENQVKSWRNSMQYMYKVLNDKEIPGDSGIAVEFNIPNTSKRVDFIVSGYDSKEQDSVVVIELKQWEKCEAVLNKDGIVSTYTGHGIREVVHPSYQAVSYANLIKDFNETVQQESIHLYPCAYLHNYDLKEGDPIHSEQYKQYIDEAPLFGYGDVIKLREFIKKHITEGDNKDLLYKIQDGKIRPSKRLQDCLSNMLIGNKDFTMIDEQKVVFEEAIRMAIESASDNQKRVLIVKGGPGTGKSVLAINLLVDLTNRNMVCNYVTKSSAPREVFYNKLKGKFTQTYVKNLFKGSGSYVNTENNTFDCLIVDEAHRLNKKSGYHSNLGENQVKEIMNASKFSVFFIDEDQTVTLKDIGTCKEIIRWCGELKAGYRTVELESQFRCNGSDGYLAWLDNTLEIRQTANYDFDFDYDFRVIENPNELRRLIEEKNSINNKSRLVAGYCWNWIKDGKNRAEVHDITIPEYNFEMSWNLDNSKTWAIDPNSVNEVGCIHTCQGLEFDYVGVIIGDNLRYENHKIVTDYTKRAKTDQSLNGIVEMGKKDPEKAKKIADRIIKNTYRTLMTRGMKGCYIYCTDKKLQEYFKKTLSK